MSAGKVIVVAVVVVAVAVAVAVVVDAAVAAVAVVAVVVVVLFLVFRRPLVTRTSVEEGIDFCFKSNSLISHGIIF